MTVISGFADISLLQLLLVAAVALFAAVVGGLAGYGTGALMPLVLVPLIGAEPVVPIIAISSIFANCGRAAAICAMTAVAPHCDYRGRMTRAQRLRLYAAVNAGAARW